jgi:hypothetical protein
VYVEAVSAAVNRLQRLRLDAVEQSSVEARLTNLPFEAEHGLDDAWSHALEIDPSFHNPPPFHQDEFGTSRVTFARKDYSGHFAVTP